MGYADRKYLTDKIAALTKEERDKPPDRWEIGLRNIVTILRGSRVDFEIADIVEQVRLLQDERDQLRAQLEELRKAVRGVTFDIPGSIEMDGIRVIKWDWWLERRKELEAAIEPKKPGWTEVPRAE
jgi:hypothetical protein